MSTREKGTSLSDDVIACVAACQPIDRYVVARVLGRKFSAVHRCILRLAKDGVLVTSHVSAPGQPKLYRLASDVPGEGPTHLWLNAPIAPQAPAGGPTKETR
jgi:hypothetical protein